MSLSLVSSKICLIIPAPTAVQNIISMEKAISTRLAAKHEIPLVAKLPIDPKLAAACDKGTIELFENSALDQIAEILEKL